MQWNYTNVFHIRVVHAWFLLSQALVKFPVEVFASVQSLTLHHPRVNIFILKARIDVEILETYDSDRISWNFLGNVMECPKIGILVCDYALCRRRKG